MNPNPQNPIDPPKTQPQPKIDYSSQLFTSYGTKKDSDKILQSLIEEIRIQNQKGEAKLLEKIYANDIKSRKNNIINEKNRMKSDIPIDGDIVNGSRVFMRSCITCHSLETNNQGMKTSGPALGMIYGRKVGVDPFFDYSKGLLEADFLWTEKRLFSFVSNPKAMIPDVKCEILDGGIQDIEDRTDLTQFLKRFAKELHKNLRFKANNLYGKDYVDKNIVTRKGMSQKEYIQTNIKNKMEGQA